MCKVIKTLFYFDEQTVEPYNPGSNDSKTEDLINAQHKLRVSIEKLSFWTTRLTYILIIIGIIQTILVILQLCANK